ncbi:MAG: hypothetical protein LBE10_05720 [Treponema sp.]|nr:hypothetical protein [Treponema sp.]
MDAFTAAIAAAKAVKDNTAATQAEVDAALSALNAARTTFMDTKAPGNKTSNFTVAELTELLTAASSVKAGVVSSVDGSDVSPSVQWVPAATLAALNTAITAAEAITEASSQTDRDTAYTALNAEKNNFNTAKKPGTKAVALSGKIYFEYQSKIVFSVTSTLSGTYTASQALYQNDNDGYVLTNGKYTYKEGETGTYEVNEGNLTVTLIPTKVRWTDGNSWTWTVVNEAEYRARTQDMPDGYRDEMGQTNFNEALAAMGFSSVSQCIDYWVSEEFAGRSMSYSFSNDGALFLDGSLPSNTLPNELSGKTLTRINYYSGGTVEFTGGYTYTIKRDGSPIESGTYSLSSDDESSDGGFKLVNLKAQTREGMNRTAYYASLSSYNSAEYYENIIARKAAETNGIFTVYQAEYKLNGGTDEIYVWRH